MLALTYLGGEQFVKLLKVLAMCAALVSTVVATVLVAPLIVSACSCVLVCAGKAALVVGLFAAIAMGPKVIGGLNSNAQR